MIRKITVKKEIRTLGVDFCNPLRIIGAIARGGQYLDGFALFPESKLDMWSLGSAIKKLRFFPELRAIMTHDRRSRADARAIERLTNMPVIEVSSTRRRSQDRYELYENARKRLWVKSSLQTQILKDILFTTWTFGPLPEPLRIAHLVAESLIPSEKPAFLG